MPEDPSYAQLFQGYEKIFNKFWASEWLSSQVVHSALICASTFYIFIPDEPIALRKSFLLSTETRVVSYELYPRMVSNVLRVFGEKVPAFIDSESNTPIAVCRKKVPSRDKNWKYFYYPHANPMHSKYIAMRNRDQIRVLFHDASRRGSEQLSYAFARKRESPDSQYYYL